MSQMNKKEVKITSQRFRKAANNLYNCHFQDYRVKLNRFLQCIENEELIKDRISKAVSKSGLTPADAVNDIEAVREQLGAMFDQYDDEEIEAAWVYLVLKEASQGSYDIPMSFGCGYSGGSKYQEWSDGFNRRFVSTLIDFINTYLEEILIAADVSTDDKPSVTVTGDHSQVNIADRGAYICAVQDSGIDIEALAEAAESFLREAHETLSDEDYECAKECIGTLVEGVASEQPKKHLVKQALGVLKGIANGTNLAASVVTIGTYLQPLLG